MKQIVLTLILGCFVFLFVCMPSCSKISWDDESREEYLSISNTNPETLSREDVMIIVTALKRLSIRQSNDGFWYSQVQSHSEVNMSEDLFRILKDIISNHNKSISPMS